MKQIRMLVVITILLVVSGGGRAVPQGAQGTAMDSQLFDQIIELMEAACLSGRRVEVNAKGEGGISFLMRGASGEIEASIEKLKGVFSQYASEQLMKQERDDIRSCMSGFVSSVLPVMITAQNQADKNTATQFYLPGKLKVPAGEYLSILDGRVRLNISKIEEHRRSAWAEVNIDVPRRSRYRQAMYAGYEMDFEYRGKYKLVVHEVDLQDQFAVITVLAESE